MSADHPVLPAVCVIAGPTASGKSARALDVAATRNGVVINADSIQIYDALPLLSARPSPEDMRAAPHVLYASVPPHKSITAEIWRGMAIDAINAALGEGRLPIVVGGTGFYIKALMEGLSPVPEIPPAIRKEAVDLQEEMGNPAFHGALAARDAVMAARLHPNDTQRLIRAWEVLAFTGQSLAAWQSRAPEKPPYRFETELLMPDRAELRRRCDERFDAMIAAGALEEAAAFDRLIENGIVPPAAAVTHAHGFRPLQSYLRGQITLAEAIELAKNETRQYAKRQTTWFRNQIGVS